jgi:hypothetical protein
MDAGHTTTAFFPPFPRQPAAEQRMPAVPVLLCCFFYDFVPRCHRYLQRDGNSKPQFFNGRFLPKALLIDRIKEAAEQDM